MRRQDVLARIVLPARGPFPPGTEAAFRFCRLCDGDFLAESSHDEKRHKAWHRKQAESEPALFWRDAYRTGAADVVPVSCDPVQMEWAFWFGWLETATMANGEKMHANVHRRAADFINANTKLVRRAGIHLTGQLVQSGPPMRLMGAEAYRWLVPLIGNLTHGEIVTMLDTMARERAA